MESFEFRHASTFLGEHVAQLLSMYMYGICRLQVCSAVGVCIPGRYQVKYFLIVLHTGTLSLPAGY